MIWESSYWKDDLLRRAAVLERRMSQKRWPEASQARVEQDLMLGFYGIRKLIEASKLSDDVAQQSVTLTVHPPTGKPVTKMNWHKLDELFDVATNTAQQRDLRYVCHQFVHSYVFTLVTGEAGGLDGFFFASDRQRHIGLYYLPVAEAIRIFRQVGEDYPDEVRMVWDAKLKDYRITSKTNSESAALPSESSK